MLHPGIARRLRLTWLCLVAGISIHGAYGAEKVYMEAADFAASAFSTPSPQTHVLWLTPELRATAVRILGHEPAQLRQKYWNEGKKTVWILEEIGKEEVITAGFVVQDGHIEQTRVLTYRESRGDEIRYPAFLNQFQGATLADDNHLNRRIDGISGATLSVNAMVRMSRLALYFAKMAEAK
ncbi:MAG: FMN-binding protein [Rhodocyclaceae bacterium]|nr:MAG: FMN-binding protein [Rhodocyclaceae bacterium]